MAEQYTKEEILQILKENMNDEGLIPVDAIEKLTFDIKFPDNIFKNAVAVLSKTATDRKRYQELGALLLAKYQESLDIQKKIVELMENYIENADEIFELKVKQKVIDNEANKLLLEHTELKKQIDEYEGK